VVAHHRVHVQVPPPHRGLKTQFAAQQLLGNAGTWWANFTVTRPADQVQWTEFHEAFRAQHILMSKHQEFIECWYVGTSFLFRFQHFVKFIYLTTLM
jgi:hypothetical protein